VVWCGHPKNTAFRDALDIWMNYSSFTEAWYTGIPVEWHVKLLCGDPAAVWLRNEIKGQNTKCGPRGCHCGPGKPLYITMATIWLRHVLSIGPAKG
jgi:hypothetical protein